MNFADDRNQDLTSIRTSNRVLVIDDEISITRIVDNALAPRIDTGALFHASRSLFKAQKNGSAVLPGPYQNSNIEFRVDTVNSGIAGIDAVKLAIKMGNPYAAIICDIKMPGLDGIETIRQIRELDSRVQIIFMTAYNEYELSEITQKVGYDVSYVSKPFNTAEIIQSTQAAVLNWNRFEEQSFLIQYFHHLGNIEDESEFLLESIRGLSVLTNDSAVLLGKQEKGNPFLTQCSVGLESLASGVLDKFKSGQIHAEIDSSFIQKKLYQYDIWIVLPQGITNQNLQGQKQSIDLYLYNVGKKLEVLRLKKEKQQQAQLSQLGQTIKMVSHDLRGPIGSIETLIGFIEEEIPDPTSSQLQFIELIKDCCTNSMEMLEDIMDYARHGALNLDYYSTPELVKRLQVIIEPIINQNQVTLNQDIEDHTLHIDSQKIIRCLYNLIKNAAEVLRKYSKNQQKLIHFSIKKENDSILFEVQDNGPGIPEDIKSNLFDINVSKNKRSGKGLGLAIVKQFIEDHGSSINVSSSEQGTSFSFVLPLPTEPSGN